MSGNFNQFVARPANNSVNEITLGVDNLYLEQYAFTTSAAIIGSLNSMLMLF